MRNVAQDVVVRGPYARKLHIAGLPQNGQQAKWNRLLIGSISAQRHQGLERECEVLEAAWAYKHKPYIGAELRKRQAGQSEVVKAISWKLQHRLCYRYRALLGKGKPRDGRRSNGTRKGVLSTIRTSSLCPTGARNTAEPLQRAGQG